MERLGILGGTFSPIHVGHLMLAQGALDEYELDEILIMPNGNPPHKDGRYILKAEDRAEMVRLAIEDHPKFTLYEYELNLTVPGFTSDTLKHIHEERPEAELFFIIGADSLDYIDRWHEPEKIFSLATILVAPRDIMGLDEVNRDIEALSKRFTAKILPLHLPALDISSSWIRQAVSKGYHVRYYTTKPVEDYIREHALYQNPGDK